ncbi:MAG: (p)ppGpp synthetase [Tissierellia bacterium]|nr:(p)ppGpp synthetase [Tissierellia bacterium]
MKLELFDFVDEAIEYLDENSETLRYVNLELEKFFNKLFEDDDAYLNIYHRVKSPESLREKILRNNFYSVYGKAEIMISYLSDLIGLRIECRFIEDEEKLYMKLLDIFTKNEGNGYFTCAENDSIFLKLDEEQPQVQKNGFEIYKIDGFYKLGENTYNFELQIKSLVNVFWGDIDHRVLYKNYNYLIQEGFYKDIMHSIMDSLSMIDRQLMVVYKHINDETNAKRHSNVELKEVISKIIHDIYINKVHDELGFVIDFKSSADVITSYLFMRVRNGGHRTYADNFVKLLNKVTSLTNKDMNFDEYLKFDREPIFIDTYTRSIGNRLLSEINKDFKWNLFFRIIFYLEENSNADDFESFVVFLRYRFTEGIRNAVKDKPFSESTKDTMINYVLEAIVERFCKEMDINFIDDYSLDKLNAYIYSMMSGVETYDAWRKVRKEIRNFIQTYKYK